MRKILLLASVLMACGDDPKQPLADASVDAPPVPDAAPDAPALRSDGFIVISEQTEEGMPNSDVDAVFAVDTPFGAVADSDGACTAHMTVPEQGYSAGTISITGTTTPITLTPDGTAPMVSYVEAQQSPDDVFEAGAALTVQASGGDLPGFTLNVTAPEKLAGYTPPVAMSRSTGATLTWTAGAGPEMWVILVSEGQAFRVVLCKVPDNGSYTLTSSNLALVPMSSAADPVFLLLGRAATAEVQTASGRMMVLAFDGVADESTLTQ